MSGGGGGTQNIAQQALTSCFSPAAIDAANAICIFISHECLQRMIDRDGSLCSLATLSKATLITRGAGRRHHLACIVSRCEENLLGKEIFLYRPTKSNLFSVPAGNAVPAEP